MGFESILSVAGKPGLYRLVGQMKTGIIVESIEDGKRFPIHGSNKVSALEEISIYTDTEEVALKEVFKRIHEKTNGEQALSHKESNDKIQSFFEEVLPDYDRDRVYVSDMGKVVKWFNILMKHDAFDPNEGDEQEETSTSDSDIEDAEIIEETTNEEASSDAQEEEKKEAK